MFPHTPFWVSFHLDEDQYFSKLEKEFVRKIHKGVVDGCSFKDSRESADSFPKKTG